MNKKRLGILGSGYLSGIVVDAWKQGLLEDYEIVGVMGRTPETVSEMAKKAGCVACLTLDELLAQKPDYIAEAASVQMVKDSAEKILSSGSSMIVLSIGAFADHTEETHVFSGNAREAIGLLPTKVNVAVASSLATVGPENTSVNITSVPGFVGDDHKITAEIDGVKAVVDIYSSTSAIAGWSVVAVLRNIVSPVVF